MAESLRDLVVSLSLNTDNFTRNIRSVQKQIQEAQSEFQLAAAGIQNFEQTTEGLTAKLSTLERTLALQADAVGQYERALSAARDKLRECYDRQNDYAQRLDDARQKQADLAEQVQRAQTAYDGYKNTLGESDSATIAAKQNLDALKDEYRDATAEVKKLEGQNTALKKSTQNAADAVSAANVKLNQANAAMRTTQAEIDRTNAELALAQTNWRAAGEAMDAAKVALTTIGKQMKEAESRFKLATVGIKDMDTSVVGLTAKLTLLGEKLNMQERAVEQYEHALAAAEQQLEAAQQANDPQRIQQASDAVIDARTNLNNARAALQQTRQEIEQTNRQLATARSAWTAAGRSLTEFSQTCEKVSRALTTIGRTMTMYVTTPITTLATTAVKASMDFESAFADVQKVTTATSAEFEQLSADIKEMSTRLAASTTDIAAVVTSASRLGIQTDKLMDFTEVMINLGNSTDMAADEAATSMARFANIMGMDQSLFSNMGSTLVALGNNYATTESEIMAMAQRMAGAGKQVGLTEAQVLGFSAALSAVGIEAQMGGSAFSKALVKMEVASATGGEALDDFGKVAGMTGKQFKALWDSDPAAAFQAFIVGLSQMDEEGISAIAVLDEIGISEIRLRDTILRATNATELFANTQVTANAAWNANTELATVAEKRYATTASKLTNLKNTAMLFAQTIGDDLNPTIQKMIQGASDFLNKLLEMDKGQREQIIRWAAIAAAIGPVFLLLGKVTKGISVVSKGLGIFATAVGKAGGGFKGFFSVLGSSPAVWFAVAAATIAATVAIVDYVSGAKKAREALKGMQEVADNWKNTAADTFYGKSGAGLSFFGMSTDDFSQESAESIQAAQDWYNGLIAVWTDGKKETNAIVKEWTESWKALTAGTRNSLKELQQNATDKGYTGLAGQIQTDIDSLDAMDREIAALLKKRQSKLFTAEDQQRLQELITARGAIEIKYHLVEADADGFETIQSKVQAEIARARARGLDDADVTVYENALVASAQGMAAVTAQIDAQYDSEYALIQLIEDGAERQAAMDDLNARYLEQRHAAALEYAQTMAGVIMPVWNQDDIQGAGDQVDRLTQLLRQYYLAQDDEKPAILEQMEQLATEMDEGAMTEYLSILTQIQALLDADLSQEEISAMFPDIDFTSALEQIAAIQSFLSNRSAELPGLSSMFGEALPEEVLQIATDLDMTGAQARWDEFASNPGAITTDAIIASYTDAEEAKIIQPQVDAFIAKYTEIPEGADKSALTPEGLIAYVSMYAQATNGADVSGITPDNIVALVAGYKELAEGADISTLKPDEIVAYVSAYAKAQGVDISGITPEGLTAFVMAYEEATGGALTTALKPSDVTAMVVRYLEAEGVDISKLSSAQVDGIVTAFAEATGCDKSTLLQDFTAYIVRYDDTNAQRPVISATVGIYGYDLIAYRKFIRDNPMEIAGVLKLSEVYENPTDALTDANAKFYKDGVEIPVEAVPQELLTANRVAVLDNDGTMHILLAADVTGAEEAIAELRTEITEVDQFGTTALGKAVGLLPTTTMDLIDSAMSRMAKYKEGGFWNWLTGATNKNTLDFSMRSDFSADRVAELSTYVAEVVSAISQGKEVSEEDLTNLQSILTFLQELDTTETGTHVLEGVAEGMTAAGWDSDAETVASNLETALNSALDINSPSKRVQPIGDYVAQGVAQGMTDYDFSSDASAIAGQIESALRSGIPIGTMQSIGLNVMAGLASGIRSGQSGVVSAMRTAAKAAVTAAKAQLQIHSPSRIFRDEVGVMTMKGFGEGILRETKQQAKVIRNASRFLTGEAKEGAVISGGTTNNRTYNQDSSVNFTGSTFYIRDDKDVQSLAIEIAALTKRRQHGRGLKMA